MQNLLLLTLIGHDMVFIWYVPVPLGLFWSIYSSERSMCTYDSLVTLMELNVLHLL